MVHPSLASVPFPPALHPTMYVFFTCHVIGHFGMYMPCTYFGIFQTMVGARSTGRTGQEQVLVLKSHAILVVHQEIRPRLVGWETHLANPSFLPCPGVCSGLTAVPCASLSSYSLAQSLHPTFLPLTLPVYLWGLGPQLTL